MPEVTDAWDESGNGSVQSKYEVQSHSPLILTFWCGRLHFIRVCMCATHSGPDLLRKGGSEHYSPLVCWWWVARGGGGYCLLQTCSWHNFQTDLCDESTFCCQALEREIILGVVVTAVPGV